MGFGGGTGNEGNRSTASSVSIGSDLKIYKTPKQQVLERDFSIGCSLFIQKKKKIHSKQRKKKRKTKNKQEGVYRVLEEGLGVIFSWREGGFLLLLLSVCLALTAIVALHLSLFFSLLSPLTLFEQVISIEANIYIY